MNSSNWLTFLLLVHPDDFHGTTQVSVSARDGSGPEAPSWSRMSRRHASLARTQSRSDARQPGKLAPLRLVPAGHVGAVQRQVPGGPDHRPQLE